MKTIVCYKRFIMIILWASCSLISCKENVTNIEPVKTAESASVEELGQMNRDFIKALLAGDAAAAANLYDQNASLLPPNEQIITGHANIQSYWQGLIDAGLIDGSVNTIDAKSDGDLGYEIGTYELKLLGQEGDTIIDKGKYMEILKLNTEGKWISMYGMWSNNEAYPTQ